MGVDARVLGEAVREPMRRWWMTRGIWLAALVVILQALPGIYWLQLRTIPQVKGWDPLLWVNTPNFAGIALGITWLLAAGILCSTSRRFFKEHAVPDAGRYAGHIFRMAYQQGVWLGVVFFLLSLTVWIIKDAVLFSGLGLTSYLPCRVFELAVPAAGPALRLFISMIWLTGLLVILPKLRWAAWVLYGSGVIGLFTSDLFYYLAFKMVQDLPPVTASRWGVLMGVVVILGMLIGFRRCWPRLAWWLYGLLVACNLRLLAFPDLLIMRYNPGWMPFETSNSWILSFYQNMPIPFYRLVYEVIEKFQSGAILLPYVIVFLGLAVYTLYIWLLYMLMQRIILSPHIAGKLKLDELSREEDR